MEGIETVFAALGEGINAIWPAGKLEFLNSLLIDGIIAGVGGVIVFLPNILLLFLAIAFLEDSGYMARAAFVMDGVMRIFGLHGKSFIPLILGFGCSVPAIMATRSIESESDRKATIMVLPLMSCGARLPIYSLLIPAFFAPASQASMMWLIYAIGIVAALCAAKLMKSTLFKGDGEVYLMELPPYRMPTPRSILLNMWDRGVMYLHKAGTIILAASIILFIANSYPKRSSFSTDYEAQLTKIAADSNLAEAAREAAHADLLARQQAEIMEYTISGRLGKALQPVFKPLGFDWRATTASIGALAAKEVFVSQLGILFAVGDADEESIPLREKLRQSYSPLQGFCMMLFSLLSIPCLATLIIIRRELNSWKYAMAEAIGLFMLAYIATFLVYQIGSMLQIGC
jgi:ferrous iron transport protein B